MFSADDAQAIWGSEIGHKPAAWAGANAVMTLDLIETMQIFGDKTYWCLVGNGWVAGGRWDDYWELLWIIPSFPTFSISKKKHMLDKK